MVTKYISYNLKFRLLGLVLKLRGILNIIILAYYPVSYPWKAGYIPGNSTINQKEAFESHFSIESLFIKKLPKAQSLIVLWNLS